MNVRELAPTNVWNYFEDLNAVPRPSKKEEKVIAFMMNFGHSLQLETYKDHAGNVIIKKDASKGMEDRKVVILQSHLDMVHQKNTDLTVQWGSVSDVTSWQVTSTIYGSQTYQSALIPLDARSHVIPGANFSLGEHDIQVSAINGLYPGDDSALSNTDSGYDIEGPKGYFIGITQSDIIEIIVNE